MSARRLRGWMVVGAATGAGGFALARIGLPSSYLFAGMLAGLTAALLRPDAPPSPERSFRAAQAVTGVVLGVLVQSRALSALGHHWAAVLLSSAATLALTILGGVVLGRTTSLEPVTASLGMIAGGASGIVGMTDELGGDDRLVAFMQYLRVLVITLLTPVLVPLVFGIHHAGAVAAAHEFGNLAGWGLLIAVGAVGARLAVPLRIPAPALLGPLLVTAVLSATGALDRVQVPVLARDVAYAVIGVRIGLGFERAVLTQMARLVPAVLASIAALLAGCFLIGWGLAALSGVSLLNGYLATTPGGLYAVLPIASGSGADTTFVLAVQSLRLLAMIVLAPLIVRGLRRGRRDGRL